MLEEFKNLDKKKYYFSLNINIYFLLFFINFISYSIYAVLSQYNFLLIEILININFIIFFYLYKNISNNFLSIKFNISSYELIFFILIFFSLLYLIFYELNLPIFIDEIAYSRRAVRTPIFTSLIFLKYLDLEYLNNIPIKYVIHFVNFLQVVFVSLMFIILKRNKSYFILFLFLFLNFIFRFILKDVVHHPPLNHFSTTIFTSFFGLDHYIFRLSYFIPFVLFIYVLHKLLSPKIENYSSIIFSLSVATFPFLLLSSVNPDHSLWGSLIFIYILIYVIIKDEINYKFILLIISIGILFRISVFTAFALIGTCYLLDIYKKKFFFIKKTKSLIFDDKIFFIILLSLPFLLTSFIGTPAFEGVEQGNMFYNFLEALRSEIIFFAFLKQIPPWYYIFILFIFFTNRRIEIIIFFIFNLVVFFSINNDLWGVAKYTLEYLFPFVVAGHLIFFVYFIKRKKFLIINMVNVLIIILNTYELKKFPSSNISFDVIQERGFFSYVNNNSNKNTKYVTKIPYRYDDAYKYISEIRAKEQTLLLGTDYGFLPQIISNYSFNDLANVVNLKYQYDISIGNKQSSTARIHSIISKNYISDDSNLITIKNKSGIFKYEVDKKDINIKKREGNFINNINKIDNLNYLLIANENFNGSRKNLIKIFLNNNWLIEKKFIDKRYRTSLILLKKVK